MLELAGGPSYRYASASLTGPGLNPWDRSRWSGGSSSGSAIAVAAGLVPFAIGSETSGSILTPAAFCGVTALRPTYGLVSRSGAMPLSWTLDKLGPFCRSAEDCGLVLETIAGSDSKDPGSAGKNFYYTPQYARKMSELRVGFAAADFNDRPDESARAAFQQALDVVRAMGVQLVGNECCQTSPMDRCQHHRLRRRRVGLRNSDHQRQGQRTRRSEADSGIESGPRDTGQRVFEGHAGAPRGYQRDRQTLQRSGRAAGSHPAGACAWDQ